MNEPQTGQQPLQKQAVRSRIPAELWDQIKTAFTSGIGLREIARNKNIPACRSALLLDS